MTRNEQKLFVEELSSSIAGRIIGEIEVGKVPEGWDGHELRQLLADRFMAEAGTLNPIRKRVYRNTVIVNNL